MSQAEFLRSVHARRRLETEMDAKERGRLLAAWKMASDPDARQRVEQAYGLDYCHAVYPEVYKSGWGKFLDRLRGITPFPHAT